MSGGSNKAFHTLVSAGLELDVLTAGGPRITGLRFQGSENLLASVPEIAVPTPYGDFHYLGGHRLWTAPEAMPRSYIPDDSGLTCSDLPDGILLQGRQEADTGIQKSIAIHLHPDRPMVTLTHSLVNHGQWDIDLAPWAITMFRLGGVAVMPVRSESVDIDGLLPDRGIVLWPYAKIHDARLHLEDDFILVAAKNNFPLFKVGTFNPRGWLAYWLDGVLFQKRFIVEPDAVYPDKGCNAEIYCDEYFIELESLGHLTRLGAGQSLFYQEEWELFPRLEQDFLPANVIDLIAAQSTAAGAA